MTYSATIEDYGSSALIARQDEFEDRASAWRWVIEEAERRWLGSTLIGKIRRWTERDPEEPYESAVVFDVREPGDPARGLQVAVTVSARG